MMKNLWKVHGEFCAKRNWEIIVATSALLAYVASVDRDEEIVEKRTEQCEGWARSCPGLEEEYKVADAIIMCYVRSAALIYAYNQITNLFKFTSQYIHIIAGMFSMIASFIFSYVLVKIFFKDIANMRDMLFWFLLLTDITKGVKLARANLISGEERSKRMGQSLFLMGPTVTLDTLVTVLLIGVGAISGVSRLENISIFACFVVLIDYVIFITFYPACLSLLVDLMKQRNLKEVSEDNSCISEEDFQTNPETQKMKIVTLVGLIGIHVLNLKQLLWNNNSGFITTRHVNAHNSSNTIFEENIFLHSYVKWLSLHSKYISVGTILSALIVKFLFFEDNANFFLDLIDNYLTFRTIPQETCRRTDTCRSETGTICHVKKTVSFAEMETQTEEFVISYEEPAWPVLSPSCVIPKHDAEMRTIEECLKIYKSERGCGSLSDDEVVMLVEKSHIPIHNLENVFGDPLRGVRLRRRIISSKFGTKDAIKNLPYLNYDYSKVMNACCENVIGYVGIPVGYAGPLIVDGQAYMVPMATTEGALVASTNRGAKAIGVKGVTSVVEDVGMTRAPAVRFPDIVRAATAKQWIEDKGNYLLIKEAFDSTSRFAKLQDIHIGIDGPTLYLRFRATTGDAMGMNMVSKGTEKSLKFLRDCFPDMEIISISGNYCSDKKAAAINWIKGRGKRVVCEALITKKSLQTILKTDAKSITRCNKIKNLSGSSLAGTIGGNNAHSANMVTAVFIATGQDPAQNVNSSSCSTSMEVCGEDNEDLYVTCTMPCLEVGTIGGGTVLPAQAACLDILGVKGVGSRPAENSARLASLICATVMAGEISLMAALVNSDLVKSHMRHNRSAINIQQSVKEQTAHFKAHEVLK